MSALFAMDCLLVRSPLWRCLATSAEHGAKLRMTRRIKGTRSIKELRMVAHEALMASYFDAIHASALYHQLACLQRATPPAELPSQLNGFCALQLRMEELLREGDVSPRVCANVLWSMAYLVDVLPSSSLLSALILHLPSKAGAMDAQQLSNSLWATAQLCHSMPLVFSAGELQKMVLVLVAGISCKANDMIPQHLSNCMWATAQLKDLIPDVLKLVPTLVARIPAQVERMIPQHLANCMWAAARLRLSAASDVANLVPALAGQIGRKAGQMNRQELSNCIWASAHLLDVAPGHLAKLVPILVVQICRHSTPMIPQQVSTSLWAAAILKNSTPESQNGGSK
ncbi:unnamed protein product [Durusdinium trenchii]|uniref:Uncharacterized protein n=2 Tax=Durusdinium trenchii TaxID=1381693 RepID=A0ABP0QAE1_9DINO